MDKSLAAQIEKLMVQNRRHTKGVTYTLPSPDSYPFQWLWDSCFHAIILSHFDIPAAKQELLSLTHHQFSNGMLPHMVYWKPANSNAFPRIRWGRPRTSSITQPPMLAYAAWQIHSIEPDVEFLSSIIGTIDRFHKYLLKYRDPRKHHLVGLIHPDESGEDNSPRFDSALTMKSIQDIQENFRLRKVLIDRFRNYNFAIKNRMDRRHWVRDVPFNAILVKNLEAQAKIAKAIGDKPQADWAAHQAKLVKDAMRRVMMSPAGVMYPTVGRNYVLNRINTWAIFSPMFAGLHTQAEAENLVRHHLEDNNEFATSYMVPTVAINEPSFDPQGFWRGPVWMITNWFIVKGLQEYGFKDEAQKIIDQSVQLLETAGFREQFNPLNGEGYGAHHFTWGCMVMDMIQATDL
ncbi:MAG TPA: trehalase family glycosidase [Candidatus Saccharimonadales bacterium]|nr:trehalase family glycosidase [Candidatus Saccharimonadales bacterium]